MIEKGRHHGMLSEDRICKQCDIGCVEDEFHFCLFFLNTRMYVNSVCLSITPITLTLGNLLIFSTPTAAKYLKICPFISTKALKCLMALEKAVKIYYWASQRGLVGLRAWSGFWSGCVAGDCVHLTGGVLSGPWHLIFGSRLYLSGIAVSGSS